VELHEQQSKQLCPVVRGGHRAGEAGRLRLPGRVDHERVRARHRLRAHADRRPAGHQGLRHRHARRLAVAREDLQRHPAAAGERRAAGALLQGIIK
jgi:hypothetical protein